MAAAGNRAVSRLVRSLQREDYTEKTVTDVEKTGMHAAGGDALARAKAREAAKKAKQ